MQVNKLDFSKAGQGYMLRHLKGFLEDDKVSEILINKPQEVYVEKYGEMTRYDSPELSPSFLHEFFKVIAKSNHQTITKNNPLFYGSLEDGSRITLLIPPTAGNYAVAIRRKVVNDIPLQRYKEDLYYKDMKPLLTLDNELELLNENDLYLIKQYQNLITKFGKCSAEEYSELSNQFIIDAVKFKKTIVLSGGTSSGKTTFLNACIKAMGKDERIILLEDTREIEITEQHNYVSLLAKSKGGGFEESPIDMQDLVKACLRLTPNRIISGENRGAEIRDFIRAAKSGHEGSMTTVHAENPKMAFDVMCSMYKQNQNITMTDTEIMNELKSTVDIVIQLNKKEKGLRQASMIYYKHANVQL